MPTKKGLDGDLGNRDLESTGQSWGYPEFCKEYWTGRYSETGFLVLGAPPWNLSKALSLLDAILEEKGGPR